jgi:hypothetical protein
MKFVSAGHMAADPTNRQEVFSDGDHISGNSLEPGGWSLENDNGAYKRLAATGLTSRSS